MPIDFLKQYLSREDWEELELFKIRTEREQNLPIHQFYGSHYLNNIPPKQKFLFLGRKEEVNQALSRLVNKTPIQFYGKPGCGKTALSNKIYELLKELNSDIHPFVFNESTVSFQCIQRTLEAFLLERKENYDVLEKLKTFKKGKEKVKFLLEEIKKDTEPVIFFENIDFLFAGKGQSVHPQYVDVFDCINLFMESNLFVIINGQRKIEKHFENLHSISCEEILFVDFIKILFTQSFPESFWEIIEKETEKHHSNFPLEFLFTSLNKNLKLLNLLRVIGNQTPNDLTATLNSILGIADRGKLENLENEKHHILVEKIITGQIIQHLDQQEKILLKAIVIFKIPVKELGLKLQIQDSSGFEGHSPEESLQKLQEKEIINTKSDVFSGDLYYEVDSFIKKELNFMDLSSDLFENSLEKAGKYLLSDAENLIFGIANLKEAFEVYYKLKDKPRLSLISMHLIGYHFKLGYFATAYYYGIKTFQLFGEDTDKEVLFLLGRIFKIFKKAEDANFFLEKALTKFRKAGLKPQEGKVLQHLSMLASLKKNIPKYLEYALAAYKIALDLKDVKSTYQIGKILGRFLYTTGEKNGGIKILKQSYQIGIQRGFVDVGEVEMFLREKGEM
ncbi:AAA family ATPase [Flexithrix dorotheae]|uniref:AAA family ATPase n=1 Tax=Flexithrix dorotheae TaxID=70993 RepID=UPI000368A625|nr:AAA family ATPase [Flexithrix dorotheae]